MHQTDIPYIFGNNVGSFISGFLAEYNRLNPGVEVGILVVGGSALAMKYGFRGTVDIDAEIRARSSTRTAINNVSRVMNIPSDFLNEDFMKSNSYSRRLWDDAIEGYIEDDETLDNLTEVYNMMDHFGIDRQLLDELLPELFPGD